mmetsp:Transcript_18007/g.45454  ORF Transcript_18007/g.45454 Transcript_18007/m.45454 type:complete len:253 (+) Transcript_18007:452-1210(+)
MAASKLVLVKLARFMDRVSFVPRGHKGFAYGDTTFGSMPTELDSSGLHPGGIDLMEADRQSGKPNFDKFRGLANRSLMAFTSFATFVDVIFGGGGSSSAASSSSEGSNCQLSRKQISPTVIARTPLSRTLFTSRQSKSKRTSPFQCNFRQACLSSLKLTLPLWSSSKCLKQWPIDPKFASAHSLNDDKISKLSTSYSFMEIIPDMSTSNHLQQAPTLPSNFKRRQASLNSAHERALESSRSSKERQALSRWP